MRYSLVAASLAGAVAAQGSWSHNAGAWGNSASDVYVTDVVTAFTTYCPEATHFSHSGTWYSVTAPTTLVITYPTTSSASSAAVTNGSSSSSSVAGAVTASTTSPSGVWTSGVWTSAAPATTPVAYTSAVWTTSVSTPPPEAVSTSVPYPVMNSTSSATPYSTGAAPTTTSPVPFVGAGSKVAAAAGAGFLAILGFAL